MQRYDRMIFNLFFRPTAIMLLGIMTALAFYGLFTQIDTGILAPLLEQFWNVLRWAAMAIMGWGLLWFLKETYTLWLWHQGKVNLVCPYCAGIVVHRNGRYGPYIHCLACGKNTSLDRLL